jgi:hypothetical protein
MKPAILLLVLSAVVLGSCTSAYKTGQTPDDVYFSPERQQDKYVNVKESDDRVYQGNDYYSYDDQYLRMKVHNRVMWSDLDDYNFYNPHYSYSYYNNWNNPWSPYTYWNYYYNPYCSPVILTSKSTMAYSHPRVFNLNTYNSSQLTNNNYSKGASYNNNNYSSRPVRIVGYTPSNSNSGSSGGNFLRNIFNGSSSSNNSSNNSSYSTGRSSGSSSGSSGSSSSSGGGGGSAPVRRF